MKLFVIISKKRLEDTASRAIKRHKYAMLEAMWVDAN